jgi:hypothetical protein
LLSRNSKWRGSEYFFYVEIISPEAQAEPFPVFITSLADLKKGLLHKKLHVVIGIWKKKAYRFS